MFSETITAAPTLVDKFLLWGMSLQPCILQRIGWTDGWENCCTEQVALNTARNIALKDSRQGNEMA